MKGVVVVDANLLVLLVVGAASRRLISRHKRLSDYAIEDFELLGLILADFDEIVLLPHVVAEVSTLARQIDGPAFGQVQDAFRKLIETCPELPVASMDGVQREEFGAHGLTDSILLHLCTMQINGARPTLLTADTALANIAFSLGYSVIDYRREFQSLA